MSTRATAGGGREIKVLSPPSNKQKWVIFTPICNIQKCPRAGDAHYHFLPDFSGIQQRRTEQASALTGKSRGCHEQNWPTSRKALSSTFQVKTETDSTMCLCGKKSFPVIPHYKNLAVCSLLHTGVI